VRKKKEEDDKAKEPEKPKELEEDAPADKRPKVAAGGVRLSETDSTINVLPCAGSSLLMALGEGGMQYLLASARATAGVKSGRYMFEARIAEGLNPTDNSQPGKTPMPKQLVRLGLSTAGSSIFLADSQDSICFDSEGFFSHGKKRTKTGTRFGRDTMAVLVNLDKSSPNANTVSLFKNGVRVTQPLPIPDNMKGKPLVPTVTYRNVTVELNLDAEPLMPLPFKCTAIGAAAAADLQLAPAPATGKCEVVLPVGLPDEGLFDWIDDFLEKNPRFTELSDRKILEWAQKSGVPRPKAAGSNDKPSMSFGIPLMDDSSVRKALVSIAPALKRSYVVGEMKANLVGVDRTEVLKRFPSHRFKKTSIVIVGEPTKEYVNRVQSALLADKAALQQVERKKKAAEAERNRVLAEKKRKAEEAKKARIEAARQKAAGETPDEAKEEEPAPADVVMEEPAEPIVLTEEEKKMVHRKNDLPDLSEKVVSKFYTSFSLPTAEEGFDDIKYEWSPADKCAERMKAFIHSLKLTQKVEDLQPGAWFKEQKAAWDKAVSGWRKMQNEWKDPAKKKALLAKKAAAREKDEDGKPIELPKIDMEDLDVFGVEDIDDVGTGEPLYANYVYEDWSLLTARFECHAMLHSWKKDLDDPDRPSFQESHMSFYYTKYFKKNFQLTNFNCKAFKDFVSLIKDTMVVNEKSTLLEGVLPEETPIANFIKITEDHRRDRQRRVDAGDETALLKFSRPSPAPPSRPPGAAQGAAQGVPQGHRPVPQGVKRPAAPAGQAPAWKVPRVGGYHPPAAPSGYGRAPPGPPRGPGVYYPGR